MHSGVFRSTFAKRRAILKRREFSLGKGEVVSSILTGSTRHAAICALFVLALFVIAQTERRTNMAKIRELCSADTLDCPTTAR
jgi:hypothetical protein